MKDNEVKVVLAMGNGPNANGRVYPPEVIQEMARKINEEGVPLVIQTDVVDPDLPPLGQVHSADVDNNNNLTVEINVADPKALKFLQLSGVTAVPNGYGSLTDENEVQNYELVNFGITNNSSFDG